MNVPPARRVDCQNGPVSEPACDVLIVGAGPGGAVAAGEFVGAGLRVVCLEQGPWLDPAGFPGATPEWEVASSRAWSSSPAVRRAPTDWAIDTSASDVGVLDYHGVGGATVLYAGQWPRLVPHDFARWPFGYEELRPYYEETDWQFGVSARSGNPAYPAGAEPPMGPLPVHELGWRVARAHDRLGWHWWPCPNAIASRPFAGRRPCVQRGTCLYGCNEGAKGSADVTHWPGLVANGCHLITGATVRRIVADGSGLAEGAVWVDADGQEHVTTARLVVLAAGGLGTPALLLRSGLANGSGMVGRNLMVHPLVKVVGLFDGDGRAWQTQAGGIIQCLEFATSDPRRGFTGGATWALGSSGGPIAAAYAGRPGGTWGADHHAHVRARLGNTAFWTVIAEDHPHPDNRVTVTADGLAVRYRTSENTTRLLAWNVERATESLREAGARHVEIEPVPANGHFLGTARLGDDPSASVVDVWGRCHEVPNLLITDASVLPTGGSANPTSTLVAVALRTARHAVEAWGELPRPRPTRRTTPLPPAVDGPSPTPQPVEPDQPLTAPERQAFEAHATRLIPAGDGMPGAADVGCGGHPLQRVLAWRPDLVEPLLDALADPDSPGSVATLRYLAVASYYLVPAVRHRLGLDTVAAPPG